MCGIAGIIRTDGKPVDPAVLARMTDTLRHRGPDDGGTWLSELSATPSVQIGLGHRRLSIIDLSPLGHQPMANEDGTIRITFNGEIYNYREIKAELAGKGHRFRSETDTEVLLHGYEEFGTDLFNKLNGMFAFALWDAGRQVLYLVRDRFGKKPLYYWPSPTGMAFASELKSFLVMPEFRREIDPEGLSRYLSYEYLPAPHSILKGVKKLLPGHFLRFTINDGFRIAPFWSIRFGSGLQNTKPRDLEAELIRLLRRSVERRLMSDVPLGVFLSGGVDSSSIAALLAEGMDPHGIKTFSIGFEEKSFDESGYARLAAKTFGTDHRERIFTPNEMVGILPEVWHFLDEPFADASILPTYMLSKFAREFVTVALGGDGGDELMAGYDPFLAHSLARIYDSLPGGLHRSIIAPLAAQLPVSSRNMSFDFRVKQFLKGFEYPRPIRNQVWLGAFSDREQKSILHPDILESLRGFDPYGDIPHSLSGVQCRDWLDEITYLYCRFYLAEDILTKVDRASMAVSLEVRAPFLDVEFAEFANNLPARMKLQGLTRKFLLKKSMEGKVPREILYRPKKGFGIPLTKWIRSDLKPVVEEAFEEGRLRREGLFNPAEVKRLFGEHVEGKRDNRKQLWTLFMFQKWRENFLG